MHRSSLRVLVVVGAIVAAGCAGQATTNRASLPPITPIMLPPAMAADTGADLAGAPWQWQAIESDDPSQALRVAAPDHYTVQFDAGGDLRVRADCNRGAGRYTQDRDSLAVGPIATTKMGCPPGSLGGRFVRALGEAQRYRIDAGTLTVELRGGARMVLTRAPH